MALLAWVSAVMTSLLTAFSSSELEAFSILAMPPVTASVTAWASNSTSATSYLSLTCNLLPHMKTCIFQAFADFTFSQSDST